MQRNSISVGNMNHFSTCYSCCVVEMKIITCHFHIYVIVFLFKFMSTVFFCLFVYFVKFLVYCFKMILIFLIIDG